MAVAAQQAPVTYADLIAHLKHVHSKLRRRLLRSAPDAGTLQQCSEKYDALLAQLRGGA
eukprot:gene17024-56601_t